MLKTKKVKDNGTTYVVRELTMRQLLPFMDKIGEGTDFQTELMQVAVTNEAGEPIGDAILDFGLGLYMKLSNTAMELNGMAGDEGND